MSNDPLSRSRELVLAEYRQAERRLIRVWEVLGYAIEDAEQTKLHRIVIDGGLVVRVRSFASQNTDNLYRVRKGRIRPRWKVRLIDPASKIRRLGMRRLWVRAPSYDLWTGEREEKFRYMFVD